MPRLSVLLPVKDGRKTIAVAVRSTLRALPRDAELIVVDDGSADGTAEVLQGIADRRLRVIRHHRSEGVAASLNDALARSDSELVGRMDGDDVTLPWRFRVQLAALGTADHVFGSLVLLDERGRLTGAADPAPVSTPQAPLHLLFENPFAHPTLLGRRAAIVGLGGYRKTAVEDYDLWLRAAAAGQRLRKLMTPVLAYRRHPGQATRSWQRDVVDPLLDDSYRALLPPHLHGVASELRASAVARDWRSRPETWSELQRHLRQESALLAPPARSRLRRRLRLAQPR